MKNIYQIFIITATSAILLGCATDITTMRLSTNYSHERVPGKFLPLNQKSVANVGEVMFTAGEYSKEASGIKHESFIIDESRTINVKHGFKNFTFYIKPGEYILFNKTNEGSYFKSNHLIETAKGTHDSVGGIFIPTNSLEPTKFFWNWKQVERPAVYTTNLATPIKGKISTKISYLNDQIHSSSPTATITYAGVSNGQIRFVYNEFTKDGYIKPAFSQEVGLDYKPNGTYAYKSALFKVYKADSISINFEILKPLD